MQSFEESFKLFKQGVSKEEIQTLRKLTSSTVEEHFALMVAKNLVKVEELLPQETIDSLKSGIEGKDFTKLRELKASLPPDASFGEIKLVLASIGKYPIKPIVAPIVRAINAYRANCCFRKCFAHQITMNDCKEKFTKLAVGFDGSEIEVREFFRLMYSGELGICRLPIEKRKEIIYWKEFEKMRKESKDLWG